MRVHARYLESQIKLIRMNNVAEFSSRASNDYGMALRVEVRHFVPYVHTHTGLVESQNKRIKLIAKPLLMNYDLPTSRWSHTVLHAVDWLSAHSSTSPLHLIRENPPSISHLRKFGRASCVPISPPQRTKLGPLLGIYVGY
jgi:hypothetical protein